MRKRNDYARNFNYWAGRDKWVCQEYREGRQMAAFLIGLYHDGKVTVTHLQALTGKYLHRSDYYQNGYSSLLNKWYKFHTDERPEFPTYAGWDGREHAEF